MSRSISLDAFLTQLDLIAASSPRYRLGGDGSDGTCDCIGLIIGAIRRAGGAWPGIHGSNYAARHEVSGLQPIASAAALSVGDLVFKSRDPGASGYALPSRYADHPDPLDYYHVGVVRSTAPLTILHCTTPGIVTDSKLGKWRHHGWLNCISQKGEAPMTPTNATVTAQQGSTVNLRESPGGALVARIPVGDTVTIIAQQNGWAQITHGDLTGWMKAEYLAASGDAITLELPADVARQLLSALTAALGQCAP
ncbi:MAG: SH3 domain-containing protein [Clostridia bacterium]|nr:SH3 domain-containing protein [Clostridia bacterium]